METHCRQVLGLIGVNEYFNPQDTVKYDPTPPNAPSVNPVRSKDRAINGKAEPGSIVVANKGKIILGKATANLKGMFTIKIKQQKASNFRQN